MPRAAPRSCREPRCPHLVTVPGTFRCPQHQSAYRAAFDAKRLRAGDRGYGSRWAKVRKAFLAEHPRCERCGKPATDADHVVARGEGGSDDFTNLRAFCHACHSSRTGTDQGGFSRGHRATS